MISILDQWAALEGVPDDAMQRLRRMLGMLAPDNLDTRLTLDNSEAAVTSIFRLKANARGFRYWRNNNGALPNPETGRPVRFGLGNDSAQANKVLKSADWIGIEPEVITPAMVGSVVGIFGAAEIKRPGWRYTGTDREVAQLNHITLVNSLGGRARFFSGGDQQI